jgi:aldose 1-epimerase
MKIIKNPDAKYKVYSLGFLQNGQEIKAYEINNKKGMSLKVMEYGATVVSLKKLLKSGEIIDVVLGFDNLSDYIDSFELPSPPYFGATVGRYAGRIAKAKFKLNDKIINLNKNNDGNSLHGGYEGFSQKVWKLNNLKTQNNPSITFSYFSPDGEENFPGNLQVTLNYTLSEDNELIVEYTAVSSEDTVVNLTHHSYFNLEGHQACLKNQSLVVNSSEILELNKKLIPTGSILKTKNTPYDFTKSKQCPESIDNTFIIKSEDFFAANLFNKKNNLRMSIYTNQPAVHIYVGGNCFEEIAGKDGANYHSRSGICFETQNYPDAPNNLNFPSAILRKGDIYSHKTIYKFQSF